MAYEIEFLPGAAREFAALDGSLKRLAAKQIDKLAEDPELGEPLGNRLGVNLTGYRRLYFGRKAFRIVYEIKRGRLLVLIIGIGRRERGEIYREVARRFAKDGKGL